MSDDKYLADDCIAKFGTFLKDNYEDELLTNDVKKICKELFYNELSFGGHLLKELHDVFPDASPFIAMDLAIFIQYFFQKCDFNINWSWLADSKKLLFLAQNFIDYSEDLNLDNNIDSIPNGRVILQNMPNLKQINFPNDFECGMLNIETCDGLTTLSLPGSNAISISYCKLLKEIRFTNGIGSVNKENVYVSITGCPSLNKLTLTRDTEVIPRSFIHRCSKLKQIIYEGTKAEWEKIKLEDKWCDRSLKIICSDGEIEINI